MNIGFIGLGIMGSRMAANLLNAGHTLKVHNRTRAKADDLLAQGATWAMTPAETAQGVDVLITMLAHPSAVEEMAFGPDGFLDALTPGQIWVDSSTVDPAFSWRMAVEARERGARFVDAPVAGTRGPAAEGTLLFLVGGEKGDVAEVQPLFDVMGRNTIHVGEASHGTALKLVMNALLAQAMLAFSEALALGEAQGLPRERLLDILVGGPLVAPFIQGKRTKIETGNYEADFPLKWMQKDLELAAETAYRAGAAMPGANLAKELYALAARQGWGEQDFSAIYDYLTHQA